MFVFKVSVLNVQNLASKLQSPSQLFKVIVLVGETIYLNQQTSFDRQSPSWFILINESSVFKYIVANAMCNEFNDLSSYVPHIMHQFSKWNLIKKLWEISCPNFDYFNALELLYMIIQGLCNVKRFG